MENDIMSSRKKIEKFCKENNISINNLNYERYGQHIYGDYSDESEWQIEYLFNGEQFEDSAYTADELIEEIRVAIDQNIDICCGACDWFKNEDCSGFGWCVYSDVEIKCDGSCQFFKSK